MKNSQKRLRRWDAFICHASVDKESVARPLYSALIRMGAQVWFDEKEIELGDSLLRTIDRGLARSRFGIVILSQSFFRKDWPEYELRGLAAKELGRDKVIIPVWHEINRDDVLNYSPPLADKIGISTAKGPAILIASELLNVIRPDLFRALHRKVAYQRMLESLPISQTDVSEIKSAPIRHKNFPREILPRIRMIRAALLSVYPHSMKVWKDGFQRDAHPTQEIELWERLATTYLEIIQLQKLDDAQRQELFKLLLGTINGSDFAELARQSKILPMDIIMKAGRTFVDDKPALEIQEKVKRGPRGKVHDLDREVFSGKFSKITRGVIKDLADVKARKR